MFNSYWSPTHGISLQLDFVSLMRQKHYWGDRVTYQMSRETELLDTEALSRRFSNAS